jgi:uncharacterized integral membrane protein
MFAWGIIAVLVLFVVINWQEAEINFFWIVTAEMPISLAILAAAGLGFAAGELMAYVRLPGKKKSA